MNLALVHSRARTGVRAPSVRVEVHLSGGLPRMSLVGLPEAAVREAKDRVRAAIGCAQFEFPARVITVNLAPADLPKGGGRFDLAIALGILAASGQAETMMWAYERADGGRSVGFTGGHTHTNWGDVSQRRIVLNALLWIAKVPVPDGGVVDTITAADLTQNLDPKGRGGN